MKHAQSLILIVSLIAVGSVNAKWSRIPTLKDKPVNVAMAGAGSSVSIDSHHGVGQVDSLLGQDITASATVSAGKSFVVVSFGKPVLISSSSFASDGLEGRMIISASADKAGWAVLDEKIISSADRIVECKFAGVQAKFVKLQLELSKGGFVRALQFFGSVTDRGVAVKQDATGSKGKPMDLLNGLGGARIIYAAPKPVNGYDTAVSYNKFAFPESDEKYRTIIYDLGQLRILNTFTSVHSPRPVRFEVFAFDNLPEKEDWRGRLAFDPTDFGNKTPVAVAEDTRGTGYLKAKPEKSVKTRYLALRWEPEFNPPDFQCSAGGMGNVQSLVTTNTVTITNADGSKSVVTVSVGDASGAGSATSEVTPSNAAQAVAQGQATMSDTTVITTATYAPGVDPGAPGATPTSTTTQTGTSVVTVTVRPNGTVITESVSTTADSSGNQTTTTITETKAANGSTTTTVQTTDSSGATTTNTNAVGPGNGAANNSQNANTNNGSTLGGGAGSPAPNGGGAISTQILTPVTSP